MHHRLRSLSTALVGVLAAALTVPAMSVSPAFAKTTPTPTYLGPDVSSYQHPSSAKYPHGKPINWTSVEKAGKAFAIVKATEGTAYTNPFFDDDYQGAADAGLVELIQRHHRWQKVGDAKQARSLCREEKVFCKARRPDHSRRIARIGHQCE